MPETTDPMTFEELCGTILKPWYSGQPLAVGDKVATPRDAAARALLVAFNAPDGQRGIIRVLVKTSEEKRSVRNYWDAFILDQPKLKAMVRKVMPEVIHLNGGLTLQVDTNEVRLAKSAISTIVLDPSIDDYVGIVWLHDGEDLAAACARLGRDPTLNWRTVRWLTPAEGAAAEPVRHPLDPVVEAGPPQDHPAQQVRKPELDPVDLAAATQRWHDAIEREARERQNEKLREGYRRISGGFA